MGMLVDGTWKTGGLSHDEKGRFTRQKTTFHDWVTTDGSSGFPVETERYHLYVSWACPWAHRAAIMRKLKGLEDVISLSSVAAFMGEDGWTFSDEFTDPLYDAAHLRDIYTKVDPGYTGRVTTPVLWDKERETIVNNESREVIRMLDTEFGEYALTGEDFYPAGLSEKIDYVIDAIYDPINNGVYRSGFATKQEAYEEAVTEVFEALDHWENVLSDQRYLCGSVITEADWCTFTTLVRFDPVYHYHFKCNLRRISDYPNLYGYLKDLYQTPGVAETVDFDHIKRHYYSSHESVNPTRIIPKGPILNLDGPHDRDWLSV